MQKGCGYEMRSALFPAITQAAQMPWYRPSLR